MLRKKPDYIDPLRLALRLRWTGPGFLVTAARDASVATGSFLAKKQKTTALARWAIPPLLGDPKDPLPIRSIRITPPS